MRGISEYFKYLNENLITLNEQLTSFIENFKKEASIDSVNHNITVHQSLADGFKQYHKDFDKQVRHLKNFSSIEKNEWESFNLLLQHYNNELQVVGATDLIWLNLIKRIKELKHQQ